ncbi:MAG: GNAT family N-acetyltransferase [Syntrophothermaceae bacterium]
MKIRKAQPEEAREAAFLIHQAVGDIANILFSTNTDSRIHTALARLFRKHNTRVSYDFIDVAEESHALAGLAVSYPGNTIPRINQPVFNFLQQAYGKHASALKTNVIPILKAQEAEMDEYYLDALAVHPDFTGRGVGTALLKHVQKKAKRLGYTRTSLLVEKNNPRAFKLYHRLGYKKTGMVRMKNLEFDKMVKPL